jgi:16S rRNA (guanine1207-N2)-methyltransferase
MNKEPRKRVDHYFSESPASEKGYGVVRTRLRGRGFEFLTGAGVFSKRQVDLGSRILVENMVLPEAGCVLDVGCGYGVVGIAAACFNPQLRVVLSDVNARAVYLARRNAEVNGVASRVDVRLGSFYLPVCGLRFDCVLSNPPVSAGMEVVRGIVVGAKSVLLPGGCFELVIRSKIGAKLIPDLFMQVFGNCSVVARESGYRVLLGRA